MRPAIDDVTRAFWTGGLEGELRIQFCDACDRWVHPPAAACAECGGPLEPRPVSGRIRWYCLVSVIRMSSTWSLSLSISMVRILARTTSVLPAAAMDRSSSLLVPSVPRAIPLV